MCVCVVLRPAAGTLFSLFHVEEEEGTAFCLAAGNFLSPPPPSPLLSLSLHENVPRREDTVAARAMPAK